MTPSSGTGTRSRASSLVSPSTLLQMGTDMMMGLVNGITGAAGFVKDAVTNTVNSAIASAKDALEIASPSKVLR